MRTAFDFSPLYRSTVGFDRMARLLNDAAGLEAADNWPPYNIEKTDEDSYRIVMAVAGFKPEALDIVQRSSASGARRSGAVHSGARSAKSTGRSGRRQPPSSAPESPRLR
jgi:molecular chaperone IbpA